MSDQIAANETCPACKGQTGPDFTCSICAGTNVYPADSLFRLDPLALAAQAGWDYAGAPEGFSPMYDTTDTDISGAAANFWDACLRGTRHAERVMGLILGEDGNTTRSEEVVHESKCHRVDSMNPEHAICTCRPATIRTYPRGVTAVSRPVPTKFEREHYEAVLDPKTEEPKSTAARSLARLSAWIDGSYPTDMHPELVLRRRIDKLMEEVGEVGQALGGYSGENPRKGVTHTRYDVMAELLDVAVTALGAWEHMDGNRGRSTDALTVKLDYLLNRVNLGAEPGHMMRAGEYDRDTKGAGE